MRRPPAGAWLRALMGCSQAGVALVDAAGHVVESNDHWAGLCAVLDPDPVERWQDLVQPEDRELVAAAAVPATEVRGRGSGAGTRWLSVSVAPVDCRTTEPSTSRCPRRWRAPAATATR